MLLKGLIASLLLGILSLPTAFSLPTAENPSVIEVHPGPGLPSLESLGWNSSYINSLPDPVFTEGPLTKRAEGVCGNSYGAVSAAIICYKFLNALGTYQCTVPPGVRSVVLAYSGNVRVIGYGIENSSYCRDVAVGVLWSIDHCTRPQQDVAGSAPAYGHGNYIIGVGTN